MNTIHNLFAISMFDKKKQDTFLLYVKSGYNKVFQSEVTQLIASSNPGEVTLYSSADEAKSQLRRYQNKLKEYILEVVTFNIEISKYKGV